MNYCKHQWEDRTDVLRDVFAGDGDRRSHVFFVCVRCMKINESAEDHRSAKQPAARVNVA